MLYNLTLADWDLNLYMPDDKIMVPLPSDIMSLLDSSCLYVTAADNIMGLVSLHL